MNSNIKLFFSNYETGLKLYQKLSDELNVIEIREANMSTTLDHATEELIMELYSNHPSLKYIVNEMIEAASDSNTQPTEFLSIVKHSLGRHLTRPVFDTIDWEYIAAQWWTDADCVDARNSPLPPEDYYNAD